MSTTGRGRGASDLHSSRSTPGPTDKLEDALQPSPSQNTILLGALTFSKIELFIKILYSLGTRFANS